MLVKQLDAATLPQARALVNRVFPSQGVSERLSFLVIAHRQSWWASVLMRLFGVSAMLDFFVAVDDKGDVIGTSGLYSYVKDEHEAAWAAWFCVAPESRRMGVGSALLDHTIEQARTRGLKYLRLYTSEDPNERAAQALYEKKGLKTISRTKRLFWTRIVREKPLRDNPRQPESEGN